MWVFFLEIKLMGLKIDVNAIILGVVHLRGAEPVMSIALSLFKAYNEIRFLRSCLRYRGLILLLANP